MDGFLESLYAQYADLQAQKHLIETNIAKVGELILLNKGAIPSAARPPASMPTREDIAFEPVAIPTKQPLYNEELNWQDKIMYVLKVAGRPCTAKQIAVKIRELEPNSQKSVEKSVELTTSRMGKNGQISARKEGVKNYYYLKSGIEQILTFEE